MATPGTPTARRLPTAVIIGRANVGKSSLFNKLIEDKKALVSDIAGTTRTNNEGEILWRGKNVRLIDTGGPDNSENEKFTEEIIRQSEQALAEADAIIFVADSRTGIQAAERQLIKKLRENHL